MGKHQIHEDKAAVTLFLAFLALGLLVTAGALLAPSAQSAAGLCQDSDAGITVAVRGSCAAGEDYCADGATLVEFSCARNACVQKAYNCVAYGFAGCRDGECVRE
ncbi:MAG: hypothetical protein HY520_03980 [Candidatus Aenigmarchaeota archaeon]|nr:hypothetical protein [Candidatus Aenigmarchaeota archaeon]